VSAEGGEVTEIRAEVDRLAERLGDVAYEALRAHLRSAREAGRAGVRGSSKAARSPDLEREKVASRARNALERASTLLRRLEECEVDAEDGDRETGDEAE